MATFKAFLRAPSSSSTHTPNTILKLLFPQTKPQKKISHPTCTIYFCTRNHPLLAGTASLSAPCILKSGEHGPKTRLTHLEKGERKLVGTGRVNQSSHGRVCIVRLASRATRDGHKCFWPLLEGARNILCLSKKTQLVGALEGASPDLPLRCR